MISTRAACCFAALLAAGACGGGSASSSNPSPSPSPSPSPPGTGGTAISGREPLAWTQATNDLTGYNFSIYVDGDRQSVVDGSCTAISSATFDCQSPLPFMTDGVHTLQVSAMVNRNGASVEGPRSAPLTVTVNAATAPLASLRLDAATDVGVSSESTPPKQMAGSGAGLQCGLAPWDDHRAVLWTSQGQVSLTASDGSQAPLRWRQADDDVWRLSGAVRDNDFESTHFVFLTLMRGDANQDSLRVARYREVQGTLGERVILLERQLDFQPTGTWTAMDADGRLLIAVLGPSADPPRLHQFVTTISRPGAVGTVGVNPLETTAPLAVAFAPTGALAILDLLQPAGPTLHVEGTTTTLRVPATPIALRSATADDLAQLFVVGANGAVFAVENGNALRPLAGLDAPMPLHDAVLLRDGTTVGCGTSGDALNVVYGRWRPVSNGQERR